MKLLAAALPLGLLAGCGGTPSALPSSTLTPTPATAAPTPAAGSCHQLTWAQATAQAAPAGSVSCARSHTAQTYAVGTLRTVVFASSRE